MEDTRLERVLITVESKFSNGVLRGLLSCIKNINNEMLISEIVPYRIWTNPVGGFHLFLYEN
jgi:hypothetical protein